VLLLQSQSKGELEHHSVAMLINTAYVDTARGAIEVAGRVAVPPKLLSASRINPTQWKFSIRLSRVFVQHSLLACLNDFEVGTAE
jgi:hypothetical protein